MESMIIYSSTLILLYWTVIDGNGFINCCPHQLPPFASMYIETPSHPDLRLARNLVDPL